MDFSGITERIQKLKRNIQNFSQQLAYVHQLLIVDHLLILCLSVLKIRLIQKIKLNGL